jgi:hypothetical protein
MSSKIIKYSKEYEFDEAILALDYFLTYLNNNSNSSI